MKKFLTKFGRPLLFLTLSLFAIQCSESDYDIEPQYKDASHFEGDVAIEWNSILNELDRYTEGYKSPIAARAMAFVNLAAYEAMIPGMAGKYISLAKDNFRVSIPAPEKDKAYFWPLVLNTCYKVAIQKFYPTAPSAQQLAILDTYEKLQKKYSEKISPETVLRSLEYGGAIAGLIYDFSTKDELADAAYQRVNDPNYIPPAGEGNWQPSPPDFAPAVLPYWGNVRTLVAVDSDFWISGPPEYSTVPQSRMYKETKYVHDRGNFLRDNPENESNWIAQFWSDDFSPLTFSPASRWNAITTQILQERESNLEEAVMSYLKVSFALSDAAIGCWQNKYKYNVGRPVTYIRANMDADWNTLMKPGLEEGFYTPATPSYPSEHATYAAAATGVLANLFGNECNFTDHCHEGRTEFKGNPRTFYKFSQMAEESGFSRTQIGVNSQFDVDGGLQLGAQVAKAINDFRFQK
ncbi:MAG: vanadium-dependent haloperoxidase [Saprospiraceae bacterium]|nr:vanadium-dependent haloperoxidase [Saprospiraceae bacterium]